MALFNIHRPPKPENLASFFKELTYCLSKECESHENFITLGDFNRDRKVGGRELDKPKNFTI